jgi:hypothetical protein
MVFVTLQDTPPTYQRRYTEGSFFKACPVLGSWTYSDTASSIIPTAVKVKRNTLTLRFSAY